MLFNDKKKHFDTKRKTVAGMNSTVITMGNIQNQSLKDEVFSGHYNGCPDSKYSLHSYKSFQLLQMMSEYF